ncbi:hypothetical protein SEA_WATERT_122 [Microbacterium phage WaterT]|nr:hypothetical protein SEA_WATERT_122 [Microbacterium phage WaterT]
MAYTKRIDRYMSSETVILDDDGNEVARWENNDAHWYDTASFETLSDEDSEDYK